MPCNLHTDLGSFYGNDENEYSILEEMRVLMSKTLLMFELSAACSFLDLLMVNRGGILVVLHGLLLGIKNKQVQVGEREPYGVDDLVGGNPGVPREVVVEVPYEHTVGNRHGVFHVVIFGDALHMGEEGSDLLHHHPRGNLDELLEFGFGNRPELLVAEGLAVELRELFRGDNRVPLVVFLWEQ